MQRAGTVRLIWIHVPTNNPSFIIQKGNTNANYTQNHIKLDVHSNEEFQIEIFTSVTGGVA